MRRRIASLLYGGCATLLIASPPLDALAVIRATCYAVVAQGDPTMAEPSEPGKNESKELLEELPPAKKASLEGSHSCERPYMIDGREGAYALIQAFLPLDLKPV